jgi:hypothetical protein
VAKNNTTFRIKDVKELTYAVFEKNTKDVWTKAEEHVVKIEKEYCKEAIVLRNYSTKPSYIFQLKRELKVWKYIFNLFHFKMLIQNRNPKFNLCVCLF